MAGSFPRLSRCNHQGWKWSVLLALRRDPFLGGKLCRLASAGGYTKCHPSLQMQGLQKVLAACESLAPIMITSTSEWGDGQRDHRKLSTYVNHEYYWEASNHYFHHALPRGQTSKSLEHAFFSSSLTTSLLIYQISISRILLNFYFFLWKF